MIEPKRYSVIDADGVVVNIILWDGVSDYHPGEGLTLRPEEAGDAVPGPAPEPPQAEALAAAIAESTSFDDLKAKIQAL